MWPKYDVAQTLDFLEFWEMLKVSAYFLVVSFGFFGFFGKLKSLGYFLEYGTLEGIYSGFEASLLAITVQ